MSGLVDSFGGGGGVRCLNGYHQPNSRCCQHYRLPSMCVNIYLPLLLHLPHTSLAGQLVCAVRLLLMARW